MSTTGRIGVAITVAMLAYMGWNAAQAWFDPISFSQRLGLPVTAEESAQWVRVYALRAAFIAFTLAGLAVTRQWRALSVISLVAIVMPLGDAMLTHTNGAPTTTVARHLAIALVLLVTSALLARAAASARA